MSIALNPTGKLCCLDYSMVYKTATITYWDIPIGEVLKVESLNTPYLNIILDELKRADWWVLFYPIVDYGEGAQSVYCEYDPAPNRKQCVLASIYDRVTLSYRGVGDKETTSKSLGSPQRSPKEISDLQNKIESEGWKIESSAEIQLPATAHPQFHFLRIWRYTQ